jgi:hypothetical protein
MRTVNKCFRSLHGSLWIQLFFTTVVIGCAPGMHHGAHGVASLRVSEENDVFAAGGDKNYTQGLRIGNDWSGITEPYDAALKSPILRGNNWAKRWLGANPCTGDATTDHCLMSTIGIRQLMYTPTFKFQLTPDTTDRPYAGILTYDQGLRRQTDFDMTALSLSVGVIGSWAHGEAVQTWIHKHVAHVDPFFGWSNQIPNHLAINLGAQRRRRYWTGEYWRGFSADFTPQLSLNAGSIFDYLSTGGEVRFGWGLTPEWGAEKISPAITQTSLPSRRQAKSHFFELGALGEIEGRGVAFNASLDDKPSSGTQWVTRKPWVGEWSIGGESRVALSELQESSPCRWLPDIGLSYRRVTRSREFSGRYLEKNDVSHRYGVWGVGLSRTF